MVQTCAVSLFLQGTKRTVRTSFFEKSTVICLLCEFIPAYFTVLPAEYCGSCTKTGFCFCTILLKRFIPARGQKNPRPKQVPALTEGFFRWGMRFSKFPRRGCRTKSSARWMRFMRRYRPSAKTMMVIVVFFRCHLFAVQARKGLAGVRRRSFFFYR